ncbi:MAG TPA: hypothetical protein VLK23_00185, partial [Thermodesulfobacteriota bacterium]|nr:hypothetical protein [Thermodesulfobacteriota bacterium]
DETPLHEAQDRISEAEGCQTKGARRDPLDKPDIIFGFVSSMDGSTETAEGTETSWKNPGRGA